MVTVCGAAICIFISASVHTAAVANIVAVLIFLPMGVSDLYCVVNHRPMDWREKVRKPSYSLQAYLDQFWSNLSGCFPVTVSDKIIH
jgi:hypothetical protein